MFPINCFASNFAHRDLNHLWSSFTTLFIIIAALKPAIGSRNIVISYALRGFLTNNMYCMAVFFTDPNVHLSPAQLNLKLLSIQQRLHKSEEQRDDIVSDHEDWKNCCKVQREFEEKLHHLKAQETMLAAKELVTHSAKKQELQSQLQNIQARKEMIEEKGDALRHTRPTLGASGNIFCLGMAAASASYNIAK